MMKTLLPGILLLLLLASTGCEETPGQAGGVSPGVTQPPTPNPTTPNSTDTAHKMIYLVHVQLATVEVPLGIASDSEELWSYLDEEPVSLHSRVLGMNGFRVGFGRQEDWDDIERTLKKMTGQSFQSATVQVKPGVPAPVELQRSRPTQLIFTTQEDQTLSGEHYPPSDYLLTMTCTLNEDDPSKVLMTVVPQVRSTKRHLTLVNEHGVPDLVQRPVIKTLTPLAFQLTVRNNDFLIIGPGVQARRPTSPGQAFLTKDRKGVPFETVILLRPMVHAVQLDSSP